MNSFISFADRLKQLLSILLSSSDLHAKWLNTLSYLENAGARKIAACEHPTEVKEEMLKHAAEEFRHALHLKRQMEKVVDSPFETYSLPYLLGKTASLHYLSSLDVKTSRYLSQTVGLSKRIVKEISYLLVTYAIELRAEELYPLYDELLRKTGSKVTVKSILLEEKEHLHEMREALYRIPSGFEYAEEVCAIEGKLCHKWLLSIAEEIKDLQDIVLLASFS